MNGRPHWKKIHQWFSYLFALIRHANLWRQVEGSPSQGFIMCLAYNLYHTNNACLTKIGLFFPWLWLGLVGSHLLDHSLLSLQISSAGAARDEEKVERALWNTAIAARGARCWQPPPCSPN